MRFVKFSLILALTTSLLPVSLVTSDNPVVDLAIGLEIEPFISATISALRLEASANSDCARSSAFGFFDCLRISLRISD